METQVQLPRKYAWELVDGMFHHYKEEKKGGVIDVEIPKKAGGRLVVSAQFTTAMRGASILECVFI